MSNSRLILVDGLSGSGKSSTATHIALRLQYLGIPYRYHWELEVPHPINTRTQLDGRDLRTTELLELNLSKWRAFAAFAQSKDIVTIFDGKPFHISVMDMALQDEVTQQQVVDYAGEIANLTRPLNPKLVYFRQDDVAQSMRKLGAERGEEWVQEFIQLIESSSTFRNIDFAGFAGMVQFLEKYRTLVEAAISVMDVQKLSIDTSAGDWPTYREEVGAFLSFSGRDLCGNGGNRHLCPSDDKNPARLVFDNRTDRSLAVSWCPTKDALQSML